ncbi:group 1 truncated hemoglobin [Kribbella sp. NPDC050470]|uniref:group I truncated hemoglobin n=1 Tax=unclassified Kribbella TaxID=2644121 RepID=UPI0037B5D386
MGNENDIDGGERPDAGVSDYDLIGGGPAVSGVVHRFYEIVLADPQLGGYFDGVDLARLRRHQVLLVSQVLGGPAEYDGRELADAHRDLKVSRDDFHRVVAHLVMAMQEAGVPAEVIERVGVALAGTERDVVTQSTTSGESGTSSRVEAGEQHTSAGAD